MKTSLVFNTVKMIEVELLKNETMKRIVFAVLNKKDVELWLSEPIEIDQINGMF